MKHFIYGLVNPITQEIVYIGQTTDNLEHYLKSKYWKLNEVKKGNRNWSKLFQFLNDFLPNKVTIKLLRECDDSKQFDNPNFLEQYYIKKYREINPNLLNDTLGGIGNNTHIFKTKEEISNIGMKISNKLKGRPKSKEFIEHLSAIRKGKNNPMAKKLINKIACYKGFKLIRTFEYGYEINEFLNNPTAYNNVYKVLTGKLNYMPYGYIWKYIKNS